MIKKQLKKLIKFKKIWLKTIVQFASSRTKTGNIVLFQLLDTQSAKSPKKII